MHSLIRSVLRPLARSRVGLALFGIALLLPGVVLGAEGDVGDAVSGGLTPADVLTLGGASILLSIIMGALISAIGWTKPENAATKDRFGPLLALAVGVVVIGAFAIAQGADPLVAILTGLLAGNGAMGVHDITGSAMG